MKDLFATERTLSSSVRIDGDRSGILPSDWWGTGRKHLACWCIRRSQLLKWSKLIISPHPTLQYIHVCWEKSRIPMYWDVEVICGRGVYTHGREDFYVGVPGSSPRADSLTGKTRQQRCDIMQTVGCASWRILRLGERQRHTCVMLIFSHCAGTGWWTEWWLLRSWNPLIQMQPVSSKREVQCNWPKSPAVNRLNII